MKGSTKPTRPYFWSPSAFLRINVATLAVILILLCHLSGEVVNARVLFARKGIRTSDDEGVLKDNLLHRRANEMLENPDVDKYPALVDDEKPISAGIAAVSNNDLDNYVGPSHLRDPRAAAYYRKMNEDDSRKHVKRISSLNAQSTGAKKGTPPPPDESSDDETFDSLEANREAFLEILKEHEKTPHRHRSSSSKKQSGKMRLKYDQDLQRWTLTEQQSDEWF